MPARRSPRSSQKAQKAARSEFSAAIAQIAAERKIDPEHIYIAIEAGLLGAYRRQAGGETDTPLDSTYYYWAHVDRQLGSMQIFRAPRLHPDVEDDDSYDDKNIADVTPAGFGRIAAQLAKQIILQRMRDAERDQIIRDYQDQLGTMVTGQVLRMESRNVLLDIGRGNATMPPREQMRGEFYKNNARLAVLIKEIGEIANRKTIIVSRSDPKLVELLFEREVPEIASGNVTIKLIAREAGIRTKVAVTSNNTMSIDPVGSCVGQRGVRVQEIIKELNNEKIDIIPYYEDKNQLIAAALAPAENLKIDFDSDTNVAQVTAPTDQVSLAIGKGGQNVRLAAKLLGISITIHDETGAIAGQVTGTEEYEIDQFELSTATREELINAKLTNSNDILRFRNRIDDNDRISDEEKVAIFAKAEAQVKVDTSSIDVTIDKKAASRAKSKAKK
jgi:N utilization substance protein A